MGESEKAMGPRTAEEIRGVEYDWIACDLEGHVALLSTAGGGYAPEGYLRNTDLHDAAIDAILALPTSTSALFAPVLKPGLTNIWRLVAERGLFAYDADVHGGPYRLVAAPAEPATTARMPAGVRSVLREAEFRNLRFAQLTTIPGEYLENS